MALGAVDIVDGFYYIVDNYCSGGSVTMPSDRSDYYHAYYLGHRGKAAKEPVWRRCRICAKAIRTLRATICEPCRVKTWRAKQKAIVDNNRYKIP